MPHPLGVENLRTLDDMADAVVGMRAERPSMDSAIVKLNEGVSGAGNAARPTVRAAGARARRTSGPPCWSGCGAWSWSRETTPLDVYLAKFARGRGDRRGADRRARRSASPSVQLRVLPGGAVELLSTHDQLLGGASGQSYLGCMFPAAPEYARLITQHAETIGRAAGRRGRAGPVRGRLRRGARRRTASGRRTRSSSTCARAGRPTRSSRCSSSPTAATTPTTALFLTPRGHEKHLVATDHLESELLRGLMPSDLFDIVARHGLHFDQSRQVGIVFHMISCLTEHGRVGLTAVGDTPAEADRRYREAERDPAGGGAARPRGSAAAGLRRCRAADLVRRLRLQPGDGAVPLLPVRRASGRRRSRRTRAAGTRATPRGTVGVEVPGGLVFAERVRRVGRWDGVLRPRPRRDRGRAAPTWSPPTSSADVAAQELRRPPGGEFARDLAGLLPDVESLVTIGTRSLRDGGPPRRARRRADVHDHPPRRGRACSPRRRRAAYLRWITTGLREAHGYDDARIARYLAAAPGVHGAWTEPEIEALTRT